MFYLYDDLPKAAYWIDNNYKLEGWELKWPGNGDRESGHDYWFYKNSKFEKKFFYWDNGTFKEAPYYLDEGWEFRTP